MAYLHPYYIKVCDVLAKRLGRCPAFRCRIIVYGWQPKDGGELGVHYGCPSNVCTLDATVDFEKEQLSKEDINWGQVTTDYFAGCGG